MAIRGIADSTMILSQFYDLYTEEVGIRVNIVWKELKHVLSTIELHPSEELASYLKKEVGKYLSTNIADFNEDWHKRTTQIRSIAYFEQWDNFKGAYDQALNRVSAEIDLLVLSLSRAKEKEMRAESNKNIINITGNLEAVQTGQGATTNVAQIINPGGREELLQALDDIRKYLEGGGNLSGFSKEDVVDLLDDSRAEIEKPNPNGTRLMTYLMGIAAIIQTVADLKPTYEIIKVALSHFHIILP